MTAYWKRIITVSTLLVIVVAVIIYGTFLAPVPIRSSSLLEAGSELASQKSIPVFDESVTAPPSELRHPAGMEPVLENGTLRLFMNKQTTEVAVLDKRSGQIWRSNPEDREKDPLATPQILSNLSSQLQLVYLVRNNQTQSYDSYTDSVQYNQFDIEQSESSVTVTYRFGSTEKGIESIPQKISKARFEEKLLNKLDDEADKEELDARFKLNKETQIYERREIPKAALKRLIALFELAGYSDEDLAADNQENGVEASDEGGGAAKFTVPLQYSLDGDSLIASVDTAKIEDGKPYRIHSIGLLGSFGAMGLGDQGYMLVPDGSGALINLNNGKLLSQPLILPIYGDDGSMSKTEKAVTVESSRLPVFGMKRSGAAFFGIIEDGEALAKMTADISGRLHQYNTVSNVFTVLPKDVVQLSNSEQTIRTPNRMYQGKLQIRYGFLNGEQADYSSMAAYYRHYLEQKYGMKTMQAKGDAPFYLELLGSMSKPDSFLGIPYDSQEPLTDFEQANKVLDSLNAQGIRNVRVSYNGWFNGGLEHRIPTKVSHESVLGTRKEWKALAERLKQGGGGLYPDASFLRVYRKSGYSPSRDAAQFLSRKITKIYTYDLATYQKNYDLFSHYNLSPNKLGGLVDEFLADYRDYNPGALSLHDLGEEVNSDFTASETVDRQLAVRTITAETGRLQKEAPELMVSGGNAYVLPYASHLLHVPLESNRYMLADESIPFYQLALHGYVDYAGKPFNYNDDQNMRKLVLKSLETGSNVFYRWMYKDPASINPNIYKELYATYYKDWLDEALQIYHEVNGILKQVRGQRMIKHEKLDDDVYRTTYENGLSVIVNYRNEAVTVGGETIEAEHYKVKG
ncbi:DUF5696 domain-containing protein [Paenibacillus mendelii]|uniref:DUF5696 domain-containing protein n=1 Tax=Paenibacillus mendelii TaxID=206163 RepID=A0ABV6JBH6_9BACL|nr:DUF5696 domain-containing protein [Paenibacillus mendelii]MCQ6558615.1 DUF5696 domain-containing protein [Paenibacillus mendelii]